MENYPHKDITEKIIEAAFTVHNELGYGFLEKIYRNAMVIELEEKVFRCNTEVPMKVGYKGKVVGDYFADLIVDNKIIVETKAVSKLDASHEVQLVNYLKATGINVGLLINFGRSVEIKRRVLCY